MKNYIFYKLYNFDRFPSCIGIVPFSWFWERSLKYKGIELIQ